MFDGFRTGPRFMPCSICAYHRCLAKWPTMASEGRVGDRVADPGPKFPVPSSKSKANGSSVPASQTSHDLMATPLRGPVSCDWDGDAGLLSLPSCESGRNDKTVHCSLIGWAWGIFILIYWSGSGESQWAGNRLAFKLWIESELKENLSNQRLPRCQISFFFHKFYFYKFFFFAVSFLPDSVLMAF